MSYEPKHLHKMKPGWLFPYLVQIDMLPGIGSGRWGYWSNTLLDMRLPEDQIPKIDFLDQPHKEPIKNIRDCLKYAERNCGVRHSSAFESFVGWLLHGFGAVKATDEIEPDTPGYVTYESPLMMPDCRQLNAQTLDYWYETFNLGLMIQHPSDYMAYFSQGGENKDYNPYSGSGFFATPMSICKLFADLQFDGVGDHRCAKVLDPCAGTGSMLMAASNYSLRLYAQDINYHMTRCIVANGYLYMPWLVWWPRFEVWGGPNKEQLERVIFGEADPQPEQAAATAEVETAAPPAKEIVQLSLF